MRRALFWGLVIAAVALAIIATGTFIEQGIWMMTPWLEQIERWVNEINRVPPPTSPSP